MTAASSQYKRQFSCSALTSSLAGDRQYSRVTVASETERRCSHDKAHADIYSTAMETVQSSTGSQGILGKHEKRERERERERGRE